MLNQQDAARIVIIDLGSNTARLIVMQAIPGYAYRLEDEIREVVRLREGMSAEGTLSPEAVERALSTLRLFKRFSSVIQADHIIATATSAVRDAANGEAFIARVRDEIGLDLRILSGEREAYYAAIGALNETPLREGYVVDIGGGSAQISRIEKRQPKRSVSLTLGALALTERFITTDPISSVEYEAVQAEIERQLATVDWLRADPSASLIGLGGTIRNLARMEVKRREYPLDTLHGYILSRASLTHSIEQLRTMPLPQRQNIAGLNRDRADIILPGAMSIAAIMDRLNIRDLAISVGGLREGLFFKYFWQHISGSVVQDVRQFSVLNMARTFGYRKPHADHVRFLAGRLFNQLKPLHGFGNSERDLLKAAALLHDIGTLITYDDHHKHSKMLITSTGLPGFSPREVALVGLLTRYHRKGAPSFHEYGELMQTGDLARLRCLAALLRLAEYLERGRNGIIKDIDISWDEAKLHISLVAEVYPAVELWAVQRQAIPLMEEVFQRHVTIECIEVPA